MKRGISVVPIKFCLHLKGAPYTVFVSVFAEDGTVAISHGGVEIGQGINTKVAQVAAMTLGIPMERIKIKPCSTLTSPNSITTGGSTTSELNCFVSYRLGVVLTASPVLHAPAGSHQGLSSNQG